MIARHNRDRSVETIRKIGRLAQEHQRFIEIAQADQSRLARVRRVTPLEVL